MIPKAGEIETRLREHYGDGSEHEIRLVIPELADYFKLTPHDLLESDGSHPRFWHKVHSALSRHRKLELLIRPKRGYFRYLPEKLSEYVPNHHPTRGRKASKSDSQMDSMAKAFRRLRHAITITIRELEKGNNDGR